MAHRLIILIAIGRETARILQQTRRMHQVPAQDCRVSLGEGVLAACGRSILALIAIAQTWTDLADPARIRLGRNGIAIWESAYCSVMAVCLTPSSLPVITQPPVLP